MFMTYHIDWVNDVQPLTVDCNQHLAVLLQKVHHVSPVGEQQHETLVTWLITRLVKDFAGVSICPRKKALPENQHFIFLWIKVANNLIWLRFGKLNSGPSAFGHTWPQQFAPTLFNFTALKQLSSSHAWLLCHEQHQTCWCITFLLPLKNTKILSEAQRTQDINLHCHIGLDCPIDIISLY